MREGGFGRDSIENKFETKKKKRSEIEKNVHFLFLFLFFNANLGLDFFVIFDFKTGISFIGATLVMPSSVSISIFTTGFFLGFWREIPSIIVCTSSGLISASKYHILYRNYLVYLPISFSVGCETISPIFEDNRVSFSCSQGLSCLRYSALHFLFIFDRMLFAIFIRIKINFVNLFPFEEFVQE
jgi:hypothetical protein